MHWCPPPYRRGMLDIEFLALDPSLASFFSSGIRIIAASSSSTRLISPPHPPPLLISGPVLGNRSGDRAFSDCRPWLQWPPWRWRLRDQIHGVMAEPTLSPWPSLARTLDLHHWQRMSLIGDDGRCYWHGVVPQRRRRAWWQPSRSRTLDLCWVGRTSWG